MSATGDLVRLVPEGPERDALLGLVRIGVAFKAQHVGRRPGALAVYVDQLIERTGVTTFAGLLLELRLAALRRALRDDVSDELIEKVDLAFEVVTFHDPVRGRRQVTFKRLQNLARFKTRRPALP